LDQILLKRFIEQAIIEDIGSGDHTSLATIPNNATGKAKLLVKEKGIIAGVEVALAIFNAFDSTLTIDVLIADGEKVNIGDIALYVSGNQQSILKAERLVLNTMQRMSGIATTTFNIVASLKDTQTQVLDTRKTTPNLRFLEKEAVKIGGGVNHRFGLYDMILIKDNHVDFAGGIKNAVDATYQYLHQKGLKIPVVVEVRNFIELEDLLANTKVDRVLLDNFSFADLKNAVELIGGRLVTEASGGITPENAIEYAKCGVDFISMGALTHSVKSLDMSLKAVI
jgi:nicotinate-nucleotide pyrophosphorylase (carboxylating)